MSHVQYTLEQGGLITVLFVHWSALVKRLCFLQLQGRQPLAMLLFSDKEIGDVVLSDMPNQLPPPSGGCRCNKEARGGGGGERNESVGEQDVRQQG